MTGPVRVSPGAVFGEDFIIRRLAVKLPAGVTPQQAFEFADAVFADVQRSGTALRAGDRVTLMSADVHMEVIVDTASPLRFVAEGGGKPRLIAFSREATYWVDEQHGLRVVATAGGYGVERRRKDDEWLPYGDSVYVTPEAAKAAALKTFAVRTGQWFT